MRAESHTKLQLGYSFCKNKYKVNWKNVVFLFPNSLPCLQDYNTIIVVFSCVMLCAFYTFHSTCLEHSTVKVAVLPDSKKLLNYRTKQLHVSAIYRIHHRAVYKNTMELFIVSWFSKPYRKFYIKIYITYIV
jgi:hypothetical protein